MPPRINFKLICATALSFALINSVNIPQPNPNLAKWSNTNNEAFARSSGGRSSGGSFRSSPSRSSGSSRSSNGSSSSTRSSSPSHSNSSGSSSSTQKSAPANSSNTTTGATGGRAVGGTLEKPPSSPNSAPSPSTPSHSAPSTTQPKPVQVVPHSTVNRHSGSHSKRRILFFDIDIENDDDDDFNRNQTLTNGVNNPNSGVSTASASSPGTFWLIFVLGGIVLLLICGSIVIFVFSNIHKREKSVANKERDNDIVTVSKLQVALLAYTQGLQSTLSELTRNIDPETSDGLLELLQESALILLKNADNWSHVLASSQSLKIDRAETLFNQISIQERSKFTRETLTNIKGKVKEKQPDISYVKQELCSYIVVTLLVGTADDNPLFKEVRSVESLKDALEKVASVRSDYLMKVELLWSPQEEGNSLSYDELLTEYTNMIQIS
ncbi:MAG TPA: hypothetical protein DEG17_26385 [Cyanobacteria bacterium UBA11149]|nr:hypothetical protein [Cyanobacteria bacterium UBA11367]HBE60592.1 hypothetical protein [Cyanobacteria bacterium UBA11366]HBK66945.1 hypothetical protein [Cyanobacteria bacterium UBA11166]HBR72739.1 hypothetical protein [Cyanobacteria bacterium UBA11159]HBS68854.1 hypothetical protein [Cyanobacteria bacterium UBA11153]HBW92297.1 hypothetical protein [Cyanobacteria bacterium UBA11149]HCA94597.1 hypothetical protein [Cyanobacteria bacterium UBA9226]